MKGPFPKAYTNKMMQMDSEQPTYNLVVHLTFEEGFIENLPVQTISSMFEKFGDYYLQKDTKNSVYLEFYYIDGKQVQSKNPANFCKIVLENPEFKVTKAVHYDDAPRFMAHNLNEAD